MSSSPEKLKPLPVFYSYAYDSPTDRALKHALEKHLSTLRQQGQIKGWSTDDIPPGTDQEQETLANFNRAHIILILISPDYIHSDYHFREMERAIERRKANKSYLLFVLLRKTDLEGTECSKYAAYFYPSYDKPITKCSNRDEAFNLIAQGMRAVVQEYREREAAHKARQTGLMPALSPKSRLSTPITSYTSSPAIANKTSRKRSIRSGSQIDAQLAEPASAEASWGKKRRPKSRITAVNTSQAPRQLSAKNNTSLMRKLFSSKEFGRCISNKGGSNYLFALLVLLDIIGLSVLLGNSLVVVNLPGPVSFLIVAILFLWGVFNIFLPMAIVLSLIFGGAWALVVSHYQGWSGTPIFVIVIVVAIFNFFLFKSHKKAGILSLP